MRLDNLKRKEVYLALDCDRGWKAIFRGVLLADGVPVLTIRSSYWLETVSQHHPSWVLSVPSQGN